MIDGTLEGCGLCGGSVGGGRSFRQAGRKITGIADLWRSFCVSANGLDRAAVREQSDVRGAHVFIARKAFARGLDTGDVATSDEGARLVNREPVFDAVGESARDKRGVIGEPTGHVTGFP